MNCDPAFKVDCTMKLFRVGRISGALVGVGVGRIFYSWVGVEVGVDKSADAGDKELQMYEW